MLSSKGMRGWDTCDVLVQEQCSTIGETHSDISSGGMTASEPCMLLREVCSFLTSSCGRQGRQGGDETSLGDHNPDIICN